MSWVLILNSNVVAKPPAVIGGYKTRVEAETAGDLATAFIGSSMSASMPYYSSYVVIPGAACSEPAGSTYSCVERNDDWMLERYKKKFGDVA